MRNSGTVQEKTITIRQALPGLKAVSRSTHRQPYSPAIPITQKRMPRSSQSSVTARLLTPLLRAKPAVVVLDKTPFYAESGGQIGDSGSVTTPDSTFTVETTSKTENGHYLHLGAMTEGALHVGDTVSAKIDADKRSRTMRNHTAAHLLQAALRTVLGDHVHQAGQLVTDSRCRFDFSHFAAMTHEEIKKVEALVNEKILEAIPVVTQELPIAEARKLGAMHCSAKSTATSFVL